MKIQLTKGVLLAHRIVDDAVAQVLAYRHKRGYLSSLKLTQVRCRDEEAESDAGEYRYAFEGVVVTMAEDSSSEQRIDGSVLIRPDGNFFPRVSVSGKLRCEQWEWTLEHAVYNQSGLCVNVLTGEGCDSTPIREDIVARN
ncbi:MAG: hypothetical protein WCO52_03485 [bacterium]